MNRVRNGDEAGLAELLDRYWDPLVRYAIGFVGDVDSAEDLVQEAFVRVWQFTEQQIDSSYVYRDNSNPQYPNSNMFDLVFRDYAPMQQHNLSVRGGSETVRYFLSGSWMEQRGILASDEIDLDRYNIRSNLDISR